MTAELIWRSMPLSPKELSLARVLRCGQTFRWKNVNNVWSFSAKDKVIFLKQDEKYLHYASISRENTITPENHLDSTQKFIHDYFNLDVQLDVLYKTWSEVEARFLKSQKNVSFSFFPGIRILRQEPWETVVSFICSSNNNVKRISNMCDSLCTEYGSFLAEHDGVRYHTFPDPEALVELHVEARLRELGFGYRAKYIHQTARMFVDDEAQAISMDALYGLRQRTYEEAHDFLLQLTGVGPKVADCICLMALDKHDVVPVDTHVLQIAVRDYKFKGPKTMTQKSYHQVLAHLRALFGEYAGWAQLVMFAADLSDLDNGINQVNGEIVKHEIKIEKKNGNQGLVSRRKETLYLLEVEIMKEVMVGKTLKKRTISTSRTSKRVKTTA